MLLKKKAGVGEQAAGAAATTHLASDQGLQLLSRWQHRASTLARPSFLHKSEQRRENRRIWNNRYLAKLCEREAFFKRAGATAQRPASLKLTLDMIIEGIKKGSPKRMTGQHWSATFLFLDKFLDKVLNWGSRSQKQTKRVLAGMRSSLTLQRCLETRWRNSECTNRMKGLLSPRGQPYSKTVWIMASTGQKWQRQMWHQQK